MTRKRLSILVVVPVLAVVAGAALAQGFGQRVRPRPDGVIEDRRGVPDWKVDEHFRKDVFTFVRVEYDSVGGWRRGFGGINSSPLPTLVSMEQQPRRGRGGRGGGFGGGFGGRGGYGFEPWSIDFPDSDLNFSFRLQQLTALKVNPQPIIRRLTAPDLCDYPFLYLIEPGHGISFSPEEAAALRHYLLNGGFLMVDDFWGEEEYQSFYRGIKSVFPEDKYEPKELPLDHKIFQCVYPLKEKPQVPSIGAWGGPGSDITYERRWDSDTSVVHYRGIEDDKGRLMVIICHNTDLGDGWEREGVDEDYFHEMSEKKSYPMGINIVTYAMTH
jgi:Domain of unknown function (DUF4159)